MMLLTMPAHAGHWVFTTTGSGQSTLNGRLQRTLYVPSDPTTNSVSIYALAASGTYGPATGTDPPVTYTATSDLTLTVKAVWTSDTNSDNTQPPSGIYFSEDTTATGTFSSNGGAVQASTKVDDGFQDPISQSGSSIGTSAKVHYVKSSGSTVTTTLTASVTSTGTTGAAGGTSVSASIGPITISIHAQPYNMVLASYTDPSGTTHPGTDVDNVNGIITVHYNVSSTDGSVGNLASISAYEMLDWSGNPAPPGVYAPLQYQPPSPPVQLYTNPTQRYAYTNPDKEVSPTLVKGYLMDRFSPPVTGFVGPLPFPFTTWSATQNYLFDDSATGEKGTKIPGPDNNSPFTIKRIVTPTNLAGTTGTYQITTHGATASMAL